MDNPVYITLSRQLALFRDMDVTANNLANVNTSGFQTNHVLFTSYLAQDNGRGKMAFAHDISSYRDLTGGTMRQTENTLDTAISGEGYYTVSTPLGPRYTRQGSFTLDTDGTLVSQQGYPVLDQNGQPITFSQDDKEIVIGEAGNVSVDGEDRATIGVVQFENPHLLQRVGDSLFDTEETPAPATEARVLQGVLENSNVQPVLEMTHMIDLSRGVSSTAKFIEVMYDLQRKTTSTWSQQV